MIEILVPLIQMSACLGLGACILKWSKVLPELDGLDQYLWSFVIGFGTLGWVLFFFGVAGTFSPSFLWPFLLASSLGVIYLKKPTFNSENIVSWPSILILASILFVGLIDLLEGLAPPADADSLAYHYALAKLFWGAGKIEFVPRAADGAVPLLVQLTYLPVLGLGGEKAMTIWSMLTGWIPALIVYAVGRKYYGARYSALIAVLLMTAPIVVMSSGTGQVEIRNAMFVMIGTIALAQGITRSQMNLVAIAGLCTGFFVGAKFLGLLFAVSSGLAVLVYKDRWRNAVLFTLVTTLIGSQWYIWNWVHSGDPIFPFLLGNFGWGDLSLWTPEFQKWFDRFFFDNERLVSRTIGWFFAFPIAAGLGLLGDFNLVRSGFGPYLLFLVPVVLYGAWVFRVKIVHSEFAPVLLIVVLFYVLWFFLGPSQRVRHLLPFYPIVLVTATIIAFKVAESLRIQHFMLVVILVTAGIQFGAQSVYGVNYAKFHLAGESRDQFLRRNVPHYDMAAWINQNPTDTGSVMVRSRQLSYLIDIPHFVAHPYQQMQVDLRPDQLNVRNFLNQLKTLSINRIVHFRTNNTDGTIDPIDEFMKILIETDCARVVSTFDLYGFGSRTLRTKPASKNLGLAIDILNYNCDQKV